MRIEQDHLGRELIPEHRYYGISTARAMKLFNISGYRWPRVFIQSLAQVKMAALTTIKELGFMDEIRVQALLEAATLLEQGQMDDEIQVDPLQGGAGTATNLNVNEVLANKALEILGYSKGRYDIIHPLDDVNRFQSTNDVIPTASRLSIIYSLNNLEKCIENLQRSLQDKEQQFSSLVKSGRTQYQAAVPVSLGMEFGGWAEAAARDRWRVFKSFERIKTVNIGGTAVGTGITAPRQYIFRVVDHLRRISGQGISRAENLVEATSNTDVFSEVSGIIRSHAANIIKMGNDLRFLSSDLCGELMLPPVIRGSSIMPGKTNPVIPEMMVQTGLKVLGNDSIVAHAVASGHLELNPFIPLITYTMLESLELLANTDSRTVEFCIQGIHANTDRTTVNLFHSNALVTALLPHIGYQQAEQLWQYMQVHQIDIQEANRRLGILDENELAELLNPYNLLKLGEATI